ncbi:hypothetical protein V2K91_09295 [Pseudomonas alliivorans]|nr:hypothetical protein [Pseudomonas alliivorans]
MSQLHQIRVGDCIDMMRTLPDERSTPAPPGIQHRPERAKLRRLF